MYRIISLLIAILIVTKAFAADPIYPISTITPALKANAHTVMRMVKFDVEIKSENAAVIKVSEVRSILNKNGEDNIPFVESYNPMNRISSLRGWVYDESGKRIRSVTNEDAIDQSNMGYSLYDENRIKVLDPKCLTYPLTVKYEYELNLKQTLFLPTISLGDLNTSYESVEYTVICPKSIALKYKEYNLPIACSKSSVNNNDVYSWKLSNILAKTYEPYSPHFVPNSPTIRVVPNTFMVDDSKGTTANWKEFGKWASTLLEEKDKLPEATATKIKELTAPLKTDFEKVKAVYEFMQKKTRYVSIQIGIGGWQPFGADVVDKSSYGDCKALSNYTKALLTAAGVKSHYVLVKAGDNAGDIDTSFVGSQFNHAIVCVPLGKDTIWLEATDQLLPCGFNSSFTDDRLVLLVDNENSKIVRTRVYSEKENCINRNAQVQIYDDKTGTATVQTQYIGLAYDDMRSVFIADENSQKREVSENIQIPSFSLKKFTLSELRTPTPSIKEVLLLDLPNCINSIQGSINLLPLNLMNKLKNIPDKVRNRKNELCIRRSYMENDTISYLLPPTLTASELPAPVKINSIFGSYNMEVKKEGKNVVFIRQFVLRKGVHPAEEYENFREFLGNIATNDDVMLVLNKN
ncbi:MAG: DUF3857 domain-containing protein [Paludibacter sp.]